MLFHSADLNLGQSKVTLPPVRSELDLYYSLVRSDSFYMVTRRNGVIFFRWPQESHSIAQEFIIRYLQFHVINELLPRWACTHRETHILQVALHQFLDIQIFFGRECLVQIKQISSLSSLVKRTELCA